MGMISFFKEAGQKLFGHTAAAPDPDAANTAAAESIRDYINAQGLPGADLQLAFSGTEAIVTVGGLVANQEMREKIVVCCGNVHGVEGVQDEMQCSEESDECQYHTVVSGDNLSKIAKQFYGDANKYPLIFAANEPMLSHPDKIYPGQNLRIPPEA